MKKWAQQVEAQRRRYRESRHGSGTGSRNSNGSRIGTSVTEFTYMQNQPALENPYAQAADEEDEDEVETLVGSGQPSWVGGGYPAANDFAKSRNGSSSSLRSRSTTGESGGPIPTSTSAASARAPAPRFPQGSLQQPALTLRTQQLQQAGAAPGEPGGDSYFSPTAESPMTSRSSSSSTNMYPFPRQQVPSQNGYYDEGHGHSRFTAPAGARPIMNQREPSVSGPSNGYAPPGRPNYGVTPRPSYPVGGGGAGGLHSAQQMPQPRNRSASSPDIHGQAGRVPGTALRSGAGHPPVPDVPGMYQQQQGPHVPYMAPRSQSNSPANMVNGGSGPAGRASPALSRERSYQVNRQQDPSPTSGYGGGGYEGGRMDPRGMQQQYPSSRAVTPVPGRGPGTFSPPPMAQTPQPMMGDLSPPTQLKVKVHCPSASQTLTLVVPLNITYQSLKDRIDAKLQRSTNISLGDRGPKDNQVKLKYKDDGDMVSIQSDEDVQTAFETWREQQMRSEEAVGGGMMGEIELYCQR